jgi:hypothetical protein
VSNWIHIWFTNFSNNVRIGLLLILGIFSLDVRAQDRFTFRPQQSVYIVAVRGNVGDPSLSTLDLATEKEIRDGFTKRAIFNIAPSLSKADFVFLCITEYRNERVLQNVLAIALRPDDYQANRSDLIKLRDLALWQTIKSAKGARLMLKPLMNDFHSFVAKP